MNEHRFQAMGSDIVVGGGGPAEHRAIERLFRERDHAFSRFIPESELNRINDSCGRLVRVSDLFADTLRVSLRIAEETEGLVVPTLGGALEAAGYTRDFAMLTPTQEPPEDPGVVEPSSVLVLGRFVWIRPEVTLDLNGVVKSLAVDDALAILSGEGFVSAGGDLASSGELTVGLPDGTAVLLRQGAVATSGSTKRQWLRAGRVQHHLIDPRTGSPATSPWKEVTACGASCLAADVAAKASFLLGEHGPRWLDDRGVPARFVAHDGGVTTNHAWRNSMREAAACT